MNTVILSSVISTGNHALFTGMRMLYSLATASYAPPLFAWTMHRGVPLPALFLTSAISALCFGSSFIGNSQLWALLQTLVGMSNQVQKSIVRWDCVVALLAPTHELAIQIQQECTKLGLNLHIRNTAIYGSVPKGPQIHDFLHDVGVVIATPGRLIDMLESQKMNLRRVTYLVLDEADAC
ncbi:P-loop containing nucleoside triphosphate hydrolase protein [Lactarius hatsudake]|nr:P-loop containing nucleoside triphosphate hydrolase protein [Lactarius hatsudake]